MPSAEQLRSRLLKKLSELFQLDQPDLDFGFYRIMHAKAQEVQDFIGTDLLNIVADAFGDVDEARKAELQAAYDNTVREAKEEYGIAEPEKTPKAQKAKAALDAVKDTAGAEAEVYDHLYRFFERYYDDGDFISRRYYTRETSGKAAPFAVPYNGEEVKLHWANADQYYIKSAEYFSNFTFDLRQAQEIRAAAGSLFEPQMDTDEHRSLKVHFKVLDATEGEHGNVKTSEQNKRFFIIHNDRPVEFNEAGELICNFEYRPDPEKTGQEGSWRDKRNAEAVNAILDFGLQIADLSDEDLAAKFGLQSKIENLKSKISEYFRLFKIPAPTDKDKKRPVLAKYVNQYTARNTMDYFIHKDLGGFLRRELDFYIKNEVMRLDDIENAEAPAVESYLAKIKVLRRIAGKLIDFLAQLEDFQKKLWLKKKFIIETNYCITLDRVCDEQSTMSNEQKWLLHQVVENKAQWVEWQKLGFVQLTINNEQLTGKAVLETDDFTIIFNGEKPEDGLFAKEPLTYRKLIDDCSLIIDHWNLVLDTRFFDDSFKARLVASIENFDEQCDGLLIHSENFQALNLLQERYREQVKCVYIDPPYNTGGDDFLYKDSYQHSSWLSLIIDRLFSSEKLIQECGSIAVSIDLKEFDKSISLLDSVFGEESRKNLITVKRGSATGAKVINLGAINISEFVLSYSKNSSRWAPEKAYKQKAYDNRYGTIIKNYNDPFYKWEFESVLDSFSAFCGIKKSQLKNQLNEEYEAKLQEFVVDNACRVIQFVSLDENSVSQEAVALKKQSLRNKDKIFHLEREGRNDYYIRNGKAIIFYKDRLIQIGESLVPGEPVSDIWDDVLPNDLHNEGGVSLRKGKKPEKLIHRLLEMGSREGELVLDFFLGSGTTGAVSIKSKRKWIGIEHSDYFDQITLKRLKQTLYGDSSGITEITMWKGGGSFKYVRLESYEDTLNNLRLDQNPQLKRAVAANPALKEDYMLRYLLDVETRGSQSLLNIDAFADPTAYTLDVKKPGTDEYATRAVDLIETFNYLIGLRVLHTSVPQTFQATFKRIIDPELPEDQHTKLVVDGKIKQIKNHGFTQIDTDKEEKNPCSSVSICGSKTWWFRKVEGWVPKDAANPNNGQQEKVLVVWRKLTDDIEQDNLMLDEWFQKNRISTRDFEFDTIYVNGSNNLPNLKRDDENWKVRLIEEEFVKRMWEVQQ